MCKKLCRPETGLAWLVGFVQLVTEGVWVGPREVASDGTAVVRAGLKAVLTQHKSSSQEGTFHVKPK